MLNMNECCLFLKTRTFYTFYTPVLSTFLTHLKTSACERTYVCVCVCNWLAGLWPCLVLMTIIINEVSLSH